VRNVSDCIWLADQADTIIHLAAEISVDKSIDDPRRTLDVNVGGTLNILEAARQYGTQVIVASSSEVYGDCEPTDIQTELYPLRGKSPYAASKIAADRLAYSLCHHS